MRLANKTEVVGALGRIEEVMGLNLGNKTGYIEWVQGAVSLGVKRPGREADHPPLSSIAVKNAWSYTSTPRYVFMAWCLVKHRDNLPLPDCSAVTIGNLSQWI
jgi:hypothetical protein